MLRVCLLALMMSLSSCASFSALKEPQLEIKSVQLSQIQLSGGEIEITCEVDNPNSKELRIKNIDYQLSLNEKSLFKDRITKEYVLKPNAKTIVSIPLRFSMNQIKDGIEILSQGRLIKYEVIGKADVGIFTLPFTKKGEWKLF